MKDKKTGTKKEDRTLKIVTHIIGIFAGILGALIIFILTADRSVKRHARNALNWQISLLIYSAVIFILSFLSTFSMSIFPRVHIIFPFSFALSLLTVLNIIFCIVAAVKASEGILWAYPLSINFIAKIGEKNIEKGKQELRKAFKEVRDDIQKEIKSSKKKKKKKVKKSK